MNSNSPPLDPSPEEQALAINAEQLSRHFRDWSKIWSQFLEQHGIWWRERVRETQKPVYTLPNFVVIALSAESKARGNYRKTKRLLSATDEQAERSFREACESFLPDTVGVWRDQPVRYPNLFKVELNLGVDDKQTHMLMESGLTELQIKASLNQSQSEIFKTRHQLLGYAGFLTFNEQFIEERKILQKLWQGLPSDSVLPQTSASLLASPVPFQFLPGYERLSDHQQLFYQMLREFIAKWELCGFATWDLPLPQGPLQELPAGLITTLRGPEPTLSYVPNYFDIPSKVNLRDELRDSQRRAGERAGLGHELPVTDTSARSETASTHETKFRMWFAELTLRQRYGKIHGAATRLGKAFADELGISEVRIKKLRTEYSGFLD
jgi:hypothetical protein